MAILFVRMAGKAIDRHNVSIDLFCLFYAVSELLVLCFLILQFMSHRFKMLVQNSFLILSVGLFRLNRLSFLIQPFVSFLVPLSQIGGLCQFLLNLTMR